ncbi:hypothetical protein B9Z19DRAFT_1075981 [Tuber borchii]|uniref:Uncharacterized protein n=1 Tax=Tuber borchii TaxID=42251 RepID=A0A2T7A2Q4_TUBBO|nr:hypothetical protein B9Z19DRAFT_1075981 [Tuber borchii]
MTFATSSPGASTAGQGTTPVCVFLLFSYPVDTRLFFPCNFFFAYRVCPNTMYW